MINDEAQPKPVSPALPDTLLQQSPPVLQPRAVQVFQTIITDTAFVQVDIYDNATIDKDSVTVIFNDKVLLQKQILSAKPITLRLSLDPARNNQVLQLYADNLGDIPPNTALLIITVKNKRYELRVSSGLNSNAAVVFQLRN
jgi:hypothetical protein